MKNGDLQVAPEDFFIKEISYAFEFRCITVTDDAKNGIHNEGALIKAVTDFYINSYKEAGYKLPETEQIASEWSYLINIATKTINRHLEKGCKFTRVKSIPAYAIARFMFEKEEFAIIDLLSVDERDKRMESSEESLILAKYQTSGANAGIWKGGNKVDDIPHFASDCCKYSVVLRPVDIKQIFDLIRSFCEADDTRKRVRTINKNLSAFANGILDWEKKELMEFSPKYVFLSKSGVALKKNAPEPHITEPDGSDWTFDKWMDSICTDDEMKFALYALLQASVRPFQDWQKIVFFVNHVGRNGKGTFGEVLKQITPRWESMKFSELGSKFQAKSLLYDTLLISDENDAGDHERATSEALAKALATHDAISIESKGCDKITAKPYLLQINDYNSVPKMLDTTQSMQERLYMLRFAKTFRGREKKYIKEDYLHRTEVLEWIVKHVAYDMDSLERLPEVASNKELVQEVKETNNPVEAFLSEFDYNFGWNFVPMAVLYQLYTLWYKGSHAGNNTRLGDRNFGKMIRQIAVTRDDMECKKDRPKNSAYNTSKMTCPALWKYRWTYNADYNAGKLPLIDEWLPKSYAKEEYWMEKCEKTVSGVFFPKVSADVDKEYSTEDIWVKRITVEERPKGYSRNDVMGEKA